MSKEFSKNNYSPLYTKIRRTFTNLFRPVKVGSKNPLNRIHPISYIMLVLFSATAVLLVNEFEYYWIPFVSGFIFTVISMIYSNFFPLSWEEMYEYEKEAYRLMNKLPRDWNPK